ncbi:MAG: hypothetical protein K9L98_01225 [Candidatus Pacebacteria bacterium]|nr:hypothetical protein [Candidatus Paceibacterota bacterium]MCF7862613.1 hypothetical protein [Candidatus Paceibacterota bacterium]
MNDKNLKKIFDYIQNDEYIVIKLDENTLGDHGKDVDIYCKNISIIGKKIMHIANSLLKTREYDQIKLIENKNEKHVYIDFYKNNNLNFRFDLFGKSPNFKNLTIKKEFFSDCLKNRIKKTIIKNTSTFNIFIPNENHDLLFRYIEYTENHAERPEKIKHLHYVSSMLTDKNKIFIFLSSISLYVLKKDTERKNTLYIKNCIFSIKRILKKLLRI